jgi:hypothetical protein
LGIERLLTHIRLTEQEIQNVSSAKNNLIQTIKNKAEKRYLPYPKDFFLTGSYKRGTKIPPLDDVDIFYVIGLAERKDNRWHIIRDCTFDFDEDFKDDDGNISSVKILNLLKKEISKTYSRSEVRRNSEVVNVYLTSYKVGFDIVPAWEIINDNYYLIPVGGGSTKWKRSNPKIDENILNDLNKKHNMLLKNIIKIVKYWFRKKKIKTPRSYHLESIAYYVFGKKEKPTTNYVEGLIYFYKNINYNNYLKKCPDPTKLSGDLSSNLDEDDVNKILTEANKAIEHLKKGEEEFVRYVDPQLQ